MSTQTSVIVPFWGVESYFRACLTSIRNQTQTDFEVICVDDGSMDGSRAIAEEFVALDQRFRLVTQENQGLGVARNTGARHAAGRYLMFVDSDDLVAPRALQQLVGSLEESGSDFAAGNVWRWSAVRGMENAWSHAEPFAERLQRTHIREVPLLMRDRMVWNKVWRRDFWDEHQYQFPAIRFEDFPITLLAHLQATAVDTLPDPMYVWRERPSNDSISQSGRQTANASDRVTAALSVLGFVDELATHELRELVHSHLVDVDLREVLTSLLIGREVDQPALTQLSTRLADAIDPDLTRLAVPVLAEGHRALLDRNFDRARDVIRYRLGERSPATVSAVTGVDRSGTPRRRDANRRGAGATRWPVARERNATLTGYAVERDVLRYRMTFNISRVLAAHATARVQVGDHEADVFVSTCAAGIQLDVAVDTRDLVDQLCPKMMRVTVNAGPQRWVGNVAMEPSQKHGVRRAGRWIQGFVSAGALALVAMRRAHVITDAQVVESPGGQAIRLHVDTVAPCVAVQRPWSDEPTVFPVHDGVVEMPLQQLVTDPIDDPVRRTADRELVILRPSPGHPGELTAERLQLDTTGLVAEVDGVRVELAHWDSGVAFVRLTSTVGGIDA